MDLLELRKKEIQELATVKAMDVIDEGSEDILKAYLFAKAKVEFYTSFANGLHEQAITEFETYGEKEVELKGRRVSKFEAGVKYNFAECGHLELDALERIQLDVSSKIKAFKDQIKYIDKNLTMVNDDGEVFTVTPPTKTSTTKIKLIY